MRNKRNPIIAIVAIAAGAVILLSLVLPSQFWWFIFAASLIAFGIWLLRCR